MKNPNLITLKTSYSNKLNRRGRMNYSPLEIAAQAIRSPELPAGLVL